MKKLLAVLLAGVLLLSLCACGGESADPATTTAAATEPTTAAAVKVGFGAGDITPDWDCSLQGFGNDATRIYTGDVKTYIYLHCIAVTDSKGETAVIMSIDAGGGGFEKYIRPKIRQTFGIPEENIIVSAIHQHSTPSGGNQYTKLLEDKAVEAVQQALDDQAPATMYINKVETTALSFVRHYIANDPAGTIVGDNYNDAIGNQYGYKCHESESDKEMRLIKFEREGKKPIIMVNFQAHPHLGASSADKTIHGDWPAIMRETVAEKLDAHCMYLSGAGGNLNSGSRIASEKVSTDWKHHGQRAANYVVKAEKSYTQVNLGDIKIAVQTNEYENDHSMDHLAGIAAPLDSMRSYDFDGAKKEVLKYPEIHSIYHATAIVNKAAAGPTRKLTIGAISIGDVAFTYHPYEMFDTNGMELRNGTVGNENYTAEEQMENPYPMTFVCTLGNGHLGYVPSMLGYTNGGYSTDITSLAPGSGERLVGDYLQILNDLHGE